MDHSNPGSGDVIELSEGLRVIVPAGSLISARDMFLRVVAASGMLGGKLVVCREFLPGLSIEVETNWRIEHGVEELMESWEMARCLIERWTEDPVPRQRQVMQTGFGLFTIARHPYAVRLVGAMEFERRYGWG
jgi:hypothetical protein